MYRIKFKAAPQEFVVETIGFVLARDVLEVVRTNFKIRSELMIYENGKKLQEEHYVENGKTYIVRVPKPVRKQAKRKKYWYR